jgi:hypothetical protein
VLAVLAFIFLEVAVGTLSQFSMEGAFAQPVPRGSALPLLADVPFDLRHLRVIIYDVREPEWATRLRKSIADYLRNAVRDPAKSIPHPFRKFAEELEETEPTRTRERGRS